MDISPVSRFGPFWKSTTKKTPVVGFGMPFNPSSFAMPTVRFQGLSASEQKRQHQTLQRYAQRHIIRAKHFLKKHLYEGAEVELKRALNFTDPHNTQTLEPIYRRLGVVYDRLGDKTRWAEIQDKLENMFRNPAAYHTIFRPDYDDWESAMSAGEAFLKHQLPKAALNAYRTAYYQFTNDTSPELAERAITTLHALGTTAAVMEDYPQAKTAFENALAVHDKLGRSNLAEARIETLYKLSWVFNKMEQYEESLPLLKQAEEALKANGFKQGRNDKGEVNKWWYSICAGLGDAYNELGHLDKAINYLEILVEKDPSDAQEQTEHDLLFHTGLVGQYLKIADNLDEDDKDLANRYRQLAYKHTQKGLSTAESLLQDVNDNPNRQKEAIGYLGHIADMATTLETHGDVKQASTIRHKLASLRQHLNEDTLEE